jgi:hypothetical protein
MGKRELRNTPKAPKGKPRYCLKKNSYKIIGACFEVYKEKGNGFFGGGVPGMSGH